MSRLGLKSLVCYFDQMGFFHRNVLMKLKRYIMAHNTTQHNTTYYTDNHNFVCGFFTCINLACYCSQVITQSQSHVLVKYQHKNMTEIQMRMLTWIEKLRLR